MANSRDIKRRIKSVANTSKITRTMELIATAKSQQCVTRIKEALPYFHALAEIAREARKAGGSDEGEHALLEQREVKRVAILTVVANRGLCGGYNGNVMRMARDRRLALQAEGKEVKIVASGKKGVNWLKFNKIPFEAKTYNQFEDRPAFSDVELVASHLIGLFLDREVDRVEIAYTHFASAGRQYPVLETLLPITSENRKEEELEKAGEVAQQPFEGKGQPNFEILPDPKSILDAIFPLQAKLHLYRVYLEAATSEQIARRIAMKNATDNAQEVGKALRMAYNRARQNQITKEILEVLGGAEALA
ncbi:MAG: ATP synthase F1 subunit gamma [Planctomycetota bacterium]